MRGYGEAALGELAVTPGRPAIRGVHHAGEVDRVETVDVDLEALPSPLDGAGPAPGAFVRWGDAAGLPLPLQLLPVKAGARLDRRRLASERLDREIDLFLAAGVRAETLTPAFLDAAAASTPASSWAFRRSTTPRAWPSTEATSSRRSIGRSR